MATNNSSRWRRIDRLALAILVTGCSPSTLERAGLGGSAGVEPARLDLSKGTNADETCITLRRGSFGGVIDAYISSAKPDKNYGDANRLTAGNAPPERRDGLLRFDVSAIPAGASITSATATLILLRHGNVGGRGASLRRVAGENPTRVRAHQVTQRWKERAVTWNSFKGAYLPSAAATFSGKSTTTADLTTLVQGWADGTIENNGILLERDPAGANVFASSEADQGVRPSLKVCYTFAKNACVGSSYCTGQVCYSPNAPISQAACGCKMIDPACGVGKCVGTSYCTGSGCGSPVCYAPWSPVSQIMCGGAVAQPQAASLPAKVVSDGDPVGTYNSQDRGSNRGSGYWQTNAMLRHCDKMFATWQEYDPGTDKYAVKVGTNQLGTTNWSAAVPLTDPLDPTVVYPPGYTSQAMDNHGQASIIADDAGYLHLFYGPHNSAMLEAVSVNPWDASAFKTPQVVPTAPWQDTTYSSVVRDSAGTLHLVYRGRKTTTWPYTDQWRLVYQRYTAIGGWSAPLVLASTDIDGYALYEEAITVDAADSLHVAYQMYSDALHAAHAWGYLRSDDGGNHWLDPYGVNVTSSLPITPATNAHFVDYGPTKDVRVDNIAVDPLGNPWVSVLYIAPGAYETKLWTQSGTTWSNKPLSQLVSPSLIANATITFDAQGVLWVAAEQVDSNDPTPYSWFSGTSKEVVLLLSSDLGSSFQVSHVSPVDPTRPHWLASIERPTTGVPIPVPALMYTDGATNQSSPPTATDIVFVPFYKQ